MRQILLWVKAMPLTIISVVTVIAALAFLSWVWSRSGDFREEMAAQESQIQQIERMMNQRIEIPAEEPGAEPLQLTGITINQYTIEKLSGLFHGMQDEFEQVRQLAIEHNRAGRQPLLDNVFPEPDDPAVPYLARDRYREVLPRLLRTPAQAQAQAMRPDEADGSPWLIAGMPPSMSALEGDIEQFARDYRESLLTAERHELSREQIEQLNDEKRSRLTDALYRRAQQLHVYAVTSPDQAGFPLDFHELRRTGREGRPPSHEIWEAQFELWIQEDVIRAIALANEAHEPGSSVLTGPFKRLLHMEVLPGYVGLHTRGGVVSGARRPTAPYQQPDRYSAPPEGQVPRNFLVGPTGHVSNPLYDVRHVRLRAIVDYTRLPEIFDAFHAVNFMTVLHATVQSVDEYEHYRQGFVYGENVDAVEVTMVVESLWLRDWTKELMPDRVRSYLGIEPPYEEGDGRPSGAPFHGGGRVGGPGRGY